MGVKDLWKDFSDSQTKPMSEWASEFYVANHRKPKVALDTPQWLVGIVQKAKSWGFNEHRLLIRRFAAFMTAGIDLVPVFDGTDHPHKLRHKSRFRREHAFVVLAKDIVKHLGLPCIEAPGEAEALCSHLQRIGSVDFVFSDDADVLVFGATSVLSYSRGRETSKESTLNRQICIHNVTIDRRSYLLRALLQGNDYDKGVTRLGSKVASQIAGVQTGFAQRLEKIVLVYKNDPVLLSDWRESINHELQTNESKFLTRRCNVELPEGFPKPEILHALLDPPVFVNCQLEWRPPNHFKLQQIWTRPSPVRPSKQAVEALAARSLSEENVEIVEKVGKPSRAKYTPETLDISFNKCIASVMLVYHIYQKTDDPQWYGHVKVLAASDLVEIKLSPKWPYGNPVTVQIPYHALRLGRYVVRAEKRKNHLVTEMFQRVDKKALSMVAPTRVD